MKTIKYCPYVKLKFSHNCDVSKARSKFQKNPWKLQADGFFTWVFTLVKGCQTPKSSIFLNTSQLCLWNVLFCLPNNCSMFWTGRSAYAQSSLCSDLVVTTLSDVPDPRESLVARFLNNLQITHLNARGGEVGYFVFDFDGQLSVDIV